VLLTSSAVFAAGAEDVGSAGDGPDDGATQAASSEATPIATTQLLKRPKSILDLREHAARAHGATTPGSGIPLVPARLPGKLMRP
jgi:hypothetical protein